MRLLLDAIQQLPAWHRNVVMLVDVQGYDYAEAAEILAFAAGHGEITSEPRTRRTARPSGQFGCSGGAPTLVSTAQPLRTEICSMQ